MISFSFFISISQVDRFVIWVTYPRERCRYRFRLIQGRTKVVPIVVSPGNRPRQPDGYNRLTKHNTYGNVWEIEHEIIPEVVDHMDFFGCVSTIRKVLFLPSALPSPPPYPAWLMVTGVTSLVCVA